MDEALDMKVEGLKELADKLRDMGPDLSRNALRAAVRAGASTVRAEAINMAPQDTGRLRRAIYLKHIRARLARIEAKLDVLIAALSDEDEDSPLQLTLDGEPLFRDREEGAPL